MNALEIHNLKAEIGRLEKAAERLPISDSMLQSLQERASWLRGRLSEVTGECLVCSTPKDAEHKMSCYPNNRKDAEKEFKRLDAILSHTVLLP